MTTAPIAAPMAVGTAAPVEHRALAAGEAAAGALPAAEVLTATGVQPGYPGLTAPYAAAVVATLTGGLHGTVAVLVGEELVRAVQGGPVPGLDVAAAVQPALDAAAAALGGGTQVGRAVSADAAALELGASYTAVTLAGGSGPTALLLVSDSVLSPAVVPAAAPVAAPVAVPAATASRGIHMLHGVDMEVTVELGRTRLTVRELLALAPGQVLELDRAAGSPADLLVNGVLIARGEVVVVDEDFGLRITEILDESVAG